MATRILAITLFAASTAWAGAVLDVVETTGDYYTITAVDESTPSIEYWQCKVDIASGCIFSFLDLTDAGDGGGGHTDYSGTNSAYNRKCSLLMFYGRGGAIGSRSLSVMELASHLTFDAAPDGSSFTITYVEDDTTTDFFQHSYGSDEYALTPGDLLTTIVVTIRPPTSTGTAWDWSISGRNVSDHLIDTRVWAVQEVRTYIVDTIARTLDTETSYVNGYWDDGMPVSFGRFTIDPNAQGLTAGREFVIDYRYDLEVLDIGSSVTTSSWAGFDFMQYKAPYTTNRGLSLAPGKTRVDAGQLRIDIAGPTAGAVPAADAGVDQSHAIHTVDPATVNLDASGSVDTDGIIVSYAWLDIVGNTVVTGATPTLQLPEGDYYFLLAVEDNDGNVAYDEVHVEVFFPTI